MAVRLRRDFGALLNLIRAHALLHQATRDRDAEGRIVATIEEDYAAVRKLVVDLVGEGVETTVPATVRETVEAVKRLREGSKGEPVTVAELARKLELDRSTVSRRVRSAKDRGYLRDLEDNPRKPSRLVLGDDLPDDVQILPSPDDVRAGVKGCAPGSARLDGAGELHRNGQYPSDAYTACSRARVQEGIKYPPPPSGIEPGEADNDAASSGDEITLLDLVGLYLDELQSAGIVTPDGADAAEFWQVERGAPGHDVRASCAVTEDRDYGVGDIKVNGLPITFGAQVADKVRVRIGAVVKPGDQQPVKQPCEQ